MDVYDIVEELKSISNSLQSDDIKERINNVIKHLNDLQDDIFEDISSIDPYSDGNEIGSIICDLMEKVDYKSYYNNYCDMRDKNGDKVIYK